MIRIGEKALPFRIPAIIDQELVYLDPDRFNGKWVALCFVSRLGLSEATVLDHQGKALEEAGAVLLVTPTGTKSLQTLELTYLDGVSFTTIADPLGRLQRLYGGPIILPPSRCQTFFIDPDGFFRLYVAHSANDWSKGVLAEVLRAYQGREVAVQA